MICPHNSELAHVTTNSCTTEEKEKRRNRKKRTAQGWCSKSLYFLKQFPASVQTTNLPQFKLSAYSNIRANSSAKTVNPVRMNGRISLRVWFPSKPWPESRGRGCLSAGFPLVEINWNLTSQERRGERRRRSALFGSTWDYAPFFLLISWCLQGGASPSVWPCVFFDGEKKKKFIPSSDNGTGGGSLHSFQDFHGEIERVSELSIWLDLRSKGEWNIVLALFSSGNKKTFELHDAFDSCSSCYETFRHWGEVNLHALVGGSSSVVKLPRLKPTLDCPTQREVGHSRCESPKKAVRWRTPCTRKVSGVFLKEHHNLFWRYFLLYWTQNELVLVFCNFWCV